MARIVTDYLEDVAELYPNKIGFSDVDKSVTFSQVRDYSKRIASWFIEQHVFKRPIVVYLHKGVDVLISFLGCAYSGNFYTPIDPNMPGERIKNILSTLNPEYIITNVELYDSAKKIAGEASVVSIEELYKNDIDDANIKKTSKSIIDTDVLYVFFTSGSTGVPKGVIICHKAVIDYTEWVFNTFGINSSDIIGNQAPFYFDNSILDFFQSLKTGAELNIIPEKLFSDPQKLIAYLDDNHVSFIFWVPSALSIVANSGELNKRHIYFDIV